MSNIDADYLGYNREWQRIDDFQPIEEETPEGNQEDILSDLFTFTVQQLQSALTTAATNPEFSITGDELQALMAASISQIYQAIYQT